MSLTPTSSQLADHYVALFRNAIESDWDRWRETVAFGTQDWELAQAQNVVRRFVTHDAFTLGILLNRVSEADFPLLAVYPASILGRASGGDLYRMVTYFSMLGLQVNLDMAGPLFRWVESIIRKEIKHGTKAYPQKYGRLIEHPLSEEIPQVVGTSVYVSTRISWVVGA